MAKRPSFQFYPADWLQDVALRSVSVGARGLWIDMICLMHQGSEYGYLKVNHKPILPANLARMCGATIAEVEGWLSELSDAGVFSIDESGCIFSRRMIRDEEIRESRAAGGIKGGNPNLKKKSEGSEKVEEKVNLQSNLQPTPSSSSSSSSSSSEREQAPRATRLPADWSLPADWGNWALEEKPLWSNEEVLRVAADFKDYWIAKAGKDAAKLDWLATWRKWVRNTNLKVAA